MSEHAQSVQQPYVFAGLLRATEWSRVERRQIKPCQATTGGARFGSQVFPTSAVAVVVIGHLAQVVAYQMLGYQLVMQICINLLLD